MYRLAGKLRRLSEMHRNWLMCSTERIRESLIDEWVGGMRLDIVLEVYFGYFLIDLGPVQMASAQVFTMCSDNSSRGGCPCTQPAVKLIGWH
jgi:hypothetical protein